MLVDRLLESDPLLQKAALEALRVQIKNSAVSVTSIPKALKFLRDHYARLCSIQRDTLKEENARMLAEMLSVLAMASDSSPGDSLRFAILGGLHESTTALGDWGHEHVRHLAMELINQLQKGALEQSVTSLARSIVAFFLAHHAEPDACDLLYELDELKELPEIISFLSESDHTRICLYLLGCVPYTSDQEEAATFLNVAMQIHLLKKEWPQAMVIAIRLNDKTRIAEIMQMISGEEPMVKQLSFMLARQRIDLPLLNNSILGNTHCKKHFDLVSRELEVEASKGIEDIFKSIPGTPEPTTNLANTPRQNLASVYASSLVNAVSGRDTLLVSEEIQKDESHSWIYRAKEQGVLASVASIGLLHLWDPEGALGSLDRHFGSENLFMRAGAALGLGIAQCGVHHEADPALALLREQLEQSQDEAGRLVQLSSLLGLAIGYSGSQRKELTELLLPWLAHEQVELGAMAALALGHVLIGSCDGDVASAILQTLMERADAQLSSPWARFFALGLAFLFFGRAGNESEVVLETLQAIEHPIGEEAMVLLKMCAHAGTGNVLAIQELLRLCTEAKKDEKEGKEKEAKDKEGNEDEEGFEEQEQEQEEEEKDASCFAVLGMALIALLDETGKEMSHRLFSHLMHYGSPSVRKAVPLAMALLYVSQPTASPAASTAVELLGKWSHDQDKAVAVAAVLGLGLLAAGTNNAKVGLMLRQLALYYQRDADCLFVVRLAQGLVHLGKGLLSLAPVQCNRTLLSPSGTAGLVSLLLVMADAQHLLIEKNSFLLFLLVPAIAPRFVLTLDALTLEPLPVLVRVGQAVDTVGQAGKPKTITGFQTHTTPVLLSTTERAELATEEYLPVTPIIEDVVLVQKNPNWIEESK